MKKYYIATQLLLLLWTANCYAQDYANLNSSICKLFGTPPYSIPKIEIVKQAEWVYPKPAYYNSSLDIIYILEGNEQELLIAHELAHAVLSKYFIVQPMPTKMQEILAKYAEYITRKLP